MLVDCDFIKKKWKVKMTKDFGGGRPKLSREKIYIVYELEDNCWFSDSQNTHTKYIFLDDRNKYHCCTADCNIQKAFDFSTAVEETITQKPKITFNKKKLPENKTIEKSNKELLGV